MLRQKDGFWYEIYFGYMLLVQDASFCLLVVQLPSTSRLEVAQCDLAQKHLASLCSRLVIDSASFPSSYGVYDEVLI